MKFVKIFMVFLILISKAFSGENDNPGQWLKINWANDVFFQTDRYFTNGFKLEYFASSPGLNLINLIHLPSQFYATDYYSWGIEQHIFTPENFSLSSGQINDRPFASYLVVSSKKIQADRMNQLITTSELQVGLMGDKSGGEFIQNGIHTILPTSSFVPGWENQVQSEPVLNYGIELEKGLLTLPSLSVSGFAGGKLGSPYTYLNAGFRLRAGSVQDYFGNLNFSASNNWQAYFFAGMGGKFVLYNATIQGGIFTDNIHLTPPAISPYIYNFDMGINTSYKNLNVEIGARYLSPEFKSGSDHMWGYISFMIRL